jgi:transposase-like protein
MTGFGPDLPRIGFEGLSFACLDLGVVPASDGGVYFFEQALRTTGLGPAEVTTDRAAAYPAVLEELLPAAWHRTDQYAHNRAGADHGGLKARLRPMRVSSKSGARG